MATSRTPQVIQFFNSRNNQTNDANIKQMTQQLKNNALIWAAATVQHAEQYANNVDINLMRNAMRMRTLAEQCGYKTDVEE